MHIVKHAAYLGGHKLALTFEDGTVKLADLAPHLDGPIFEPLKSPTYFASFELNPDIDTVTWPNGADFSPDWLYEIGIDAALASHSA